MTCTVSPNSWSIEQTKVADKFAKAEGVEALQPPKNADSRLICGARRTGAKPQPVAKAPKEVRAELSTEHDGAASNGAAKPKAKASKQPKPPAATAIPTPAVSGFKKVAAKRSKPEEDKSEKSEKSEKSDKAAPKPKKQKKAAPLKDA